MKSNATTQKILPHKTLQFEIYVSLSVSGLLDNVSSPLSDNKGISYLILSLISIRIYCRASVVELDPGVRHRLGEMVKGIY